MPQALSTVVDQLQRCQPFKDLTKMDVATAWTYDDGAHIEVARSWVARRFLRKNTDGCVCVRAPCMLGRVCVRVQCAHTHTLQHLSLSLSLSLSLARARTHTHTRTHAHTRAHTQCHKRPFLVALSPSCTLRVRSCCARKCRETSSAGWRQCCGWQQRRAILFAFASRTSLSARQVAGRRLQLLHQTWSYS
jgi:hypothetical protein